MDGFLRIHTYLTYLPIVFASPVGISTARKDFLLLSFEWISSVGTHPAMIDHSSSDIWIATVIHAPRFISNRTGIDREAWRQQHKGRLDER
eukprot:SAG31_NODE_496_length_14862_cov_9.280837_3_plen_91_part_00